ncbi:MAG TPA: hypothetical protein VIQ30_06685, partial [Pseudonocardia sp.]
MRRLAAAATVVVLLAVPGAAHAEETPHATASAPARWQPVAAESLSAPLSAAEMNTRAANIDGLGDLWDVGRTHVLPDGRWLTLTGDATAEDGQEWPVYDNAAVIWDTTGQRRVDSPHPGGHFFPRWSDGSEFWPNDFFVVGDRAYVIGHRVKTYSGFMNWDPLGAYGAVVEVPAGGDPRWLRYFPTPSSLLDDTAVQWSGAIAYDGTHVYVHGVLDVPEAFHGRHGGYVARVPLSRLEVPHRWQFWTGTTWTGRVDLAVATIPLGEEYTTGLNGTGSGYTLHRRPDGQWQVTAKRGGDMGGWLGRYTAPTPHGPWTWQPLLQAGGDNYLAGAMPDLPL